MYAVSDGRKSVAPGPGSFLGLLSKVGLINGRTMARIRRQKDLKRYGRLLAAPAKLRERVEFRASRLVGAGTHEGVGDRTERPSLGPKSGGWGGVSGCPQSSTCSLI